MPTVEYLSQFDVLQIRTRLAARLSKQFDELNLSSLQTAIAAPRQGMFGEEFYPTLWDKAAVLLLKLIRNHPFYDGNKRIAYSAVTEFLRRNDYELTVSLEDAAPFTTAIATGRIDHDAIGDWLREHARQVPIAYKKSSQRF